MRLRRRLLLAALAAPFAGTAAWSIAQSEEQVARITTRKFVYEPEEVSLKLGVPALLEFTSTDVTMGFNAPDLGIRADIPPGQVTRVRFTPDKPGSFPYHCDVFCGDDHELMSGTIRVLA